MPESRNKLTRKYFSKLNLKIIKLICYYIIYSFNLWFLKRIFQNTPKPLLVATLTNQKRVIQGELNHFLAEWIFFNHCICMS